MITFTDTADFLTPERFSWLKDFLNNRHMMRNVSAIKTKGNGLWMSDNFGQNGEFYTYNPSEKTFKEIVADETVVNANHPIVGLPSLYSPFYIEDEELEINYSSLECIEDLYKWLMWINENLFKPVGIVIDDFEEEIYLGEEEGGPGTLSCKNGEIFFEYGFVAFSAKTIPNEVIKNESSKRNLDYSYNVLKALEWAREVSTQTLLDLMHAMDLTAEDLQNIGWLEGDVE